MSEMVPNSGLPQGSDPLRLSYVIVVDCSDWEPDIPPEKCSRGQFITDLAIIAKHFEDKEAADKMAEDKKADEKEGDTPPPAQG